MNNLPATDISQAIDNEIRLRREKLALRYTWIIFWVTLFSSIFALGVWLFNRIYRQFEMLGLGCLILCAGAGVCLFLERRGQMQRGVYVTLGALLVGCVTMFPVLPELALPFMASFFLVALLAYIYLGAAKTRYFAALGAVLLVVDVFFQRLTAPMMAKLPALDPTVSLGLELSVAIIFFVTITMMHRVIAGQDEALYDQLVLGANLDQQATHEYQLRMALETTVQRYTDFLDRLGSGDLTAQLDLPGDPKSQDPMVRLGVRMKAMAESQRAILLQIRDASERLSAATAEILAATTEQSTSASQQSSAISETTTTFEEVKTISAQVIRHSQEVVATSQQSSEFSRSGEGVVAETLHTMEEVKAKVHAIAENILALAERTQQVGEIITTVNQIASQSNILALNASVEAARAGDQGVGFAVVAAEVRTLAEQSKRATAQVRSILLDIQKAINDTVMVTEEGTKVTDAGLAQARQAGRVIQDLVRIIDQAALKATQTLSGGQQQTTGIDEIALAMHNIKQATVQSLASTRQTERAAQDLNLLAQSLVERVTQYKLA